MPVRLKQVGVATELERTIDLLTNDREATTRIHGHMVIAADAAEAAFRNNDKGADDHGTRLRVV